MKTNPNKWIFIIVALAMANGLFAQATISGYVTDAASGEVLIGAPVYTAVKKQGTSTNVYGFFSLQAGLNDTLVISYIGYESFRIAVVNAGPEIQVKLNQKTDVLRETKIEAKRDLPGAIHHTNIDMKLVNRLPALGGERDLIKAIQLMPGVKKGADGTAGMLVRGGAHDQNLILLDDAPVYNPSHLLGFFSLFNTDAIKNAGLQTGGFSACYGGRLSSVLDIHMNEGNNKKAAYSGAVGLLASRFSAQSPLFKGKGSFLAAGRISYINKIYELAGKELPFYFYDLNFKLNYRIGERDRIYASVYSGDDVLNASKSDADGMVKIGSRMGNHINVLRWNHHFSNQKMFSNLTLFTSSYRYHINGKLDSNLLSIHSRISDIGGRYSVDHHVGNRLSFKYGTEYIRHHFMPNSTQLSGVFNDNIREQEAPGTYLDEAALYTSMNWSVTEQLKIQAGLRLSGAAVHAKEYINPEPRLLLTWKAFDGHTLSLSYARMIQYMFQLSGSSAVLPTDLWYGVSEKIKPQEANIFAIGHQWTGNGFSSGTEVYYKPMNRLVEYKEGTTELANADIDDDVVQGRGDAYGLEWTGKFTSGKWMINANYALSWSTRRFDELNNGASYYARFDRRHDLNVVVSYDLNERIGFTGVWSYATGSRFTPVVGQFMMPNGNYTNIDLLPVYTGRNAVQLSAAHKLDVNMVIKNKPGKRFSSEWHIGAYNVYNQTQPFRIRMQKNNDGTYAYKQVGLFGFVPSVGYQFKF